MELLLQDMLVPPTLQHHVLNELLYSVLSILSEAPEFISNVDIFCEIIMNPGGWRDSGKSLKLSPPDCQTLKPVF